MNVRIGSATFYLTDHAVDRYIERVKPMLSVAQAREELRRMLPMATIDRAGPDWCSDPGHADSFVLLSDGIVFPLYRGRLISCLTRAEVGAELRMVRREERRKARDGGPKRKKQHGKVARQERRRLRDSRGEAA